MIATSTTEKYKFSTRKPLLIIIAFLLTSVWNIML